MLPVGGGLGLFLLVLFPKTRKCLLSSAVSAIDVLLWPREGRDKKLQDNQLLPILKSSSCEDIRFLCVLLVAVSARLEGHVLP